MPTKKLILFGWGNVLINYDYNAITWNDAFSSLSERYPEIASMFEGEDIWTLCGDELDSYIRRFIVPARSTRHGSSLESCIGNIVNSTNIIKFDNSRFKPVDENSLAVKEFRASYDEIFSNLPWYDETMPFFIKLGRDYTDRVETGILTTCTEMDAHIMQFFNINPKYWFLSCYLGSILPDERIFRMIGDVLHIKGENILFITSSDEISDAACSFGWNAVCVTGEDFSLIREKALSFID